MNRSTETKQQDVEALLPAYVLGALDTEETHLVENTIRQQREFLARLERLERKAAQLTHISQPIVPPSNVRRAIMMIARLDAPAEAASDIPTYTITSAAQSLGQNGNHGHVSTNSHLSSNGHAAEANGATYAIMPYRPQQVVGGKPQVAQVIRQRRLALRLWQIAAGAALVALLIMAAIGLLLNQQLGRTLDQVRLKDEKFETILATNSQLQVEKDTLQKEQQILRTQNETMLATQEQLALAQHQIQVMRGAESVSKLRALNGNETPQAALYLTGNVAALSASGLPNLPSDKTFQLWFVDSAGRSIPIAVFTTQADESTIWREFSLSQSTNNLQAVAISIEPLGGSVTPNGYLLQSGR